MSKDFISQLDWRSAIKIFDDKKQVSDSNLNAIYKAIQMTPTSFGLQPFYVKVIKDKPTLQKMSEAGWGQKQFTTCTAALVFVARADLADRIEAYFTQVSQGKSEVRAQMKDYEGMMKGFAQSKSPEDSKVWAQKQSYIALGFAMAACAELGVDSCPMEGFDPQQFNTILSLPPNHFSTVVLTVGYRTSEAPPFPKFRFPITDLIRH